MRQVSLALALLVPLAATPALVRADEVTDQLDEARKAYEAGELRSAVQTLQFAVASIQEKMNLSLLKLLPEPLEGWTADEAQVQSGGVAAMIAGTNLTRHYQREDGAEVEVSITADSPLLPMMTMMLSNPMMLQSNPGTRVYTHQGHRGTIAHEANSRDWEITLMLANNVLVQVNGRGLEGREPVEAYLGAMDLDAVQKAFGG